ncbi:MAG: tetratricopeptide repeat protein [Gemmatimonadota bacterium]|nr:MAG: tetratricopeptide repeat protein [Gemmatimonadota bacterium]
MSRLKHLVLEIHRRSLWQVLAVYVGASWAVLEATEHVRERFLMPEWVYGAAFIVLLVGFPIVLASALVREEMAGPERDRAAPAPEEGALEHAASQSLFSLLAGRLTWGRAVLAVVVALALVGLAGALVVVRGAARVTEAQGAAGDAFEERAWLVVAEFEAPEEEEDLGRAVRTALMTELGQSRHVNVYGDNQVRPVLLRMMLPDTTSLDERLALELAEREGLSAVLAGSIHRVGGGYQLSARVIEPGSGRELISAGSAADSVQLLEGIARLSREVRRRLGEGRAELRQSLPLPQVTTRSLDALQKYALAVVANRERDYEQALELAEEAIWLDSTFAAAYRTAAVASNNLGRYSAAVPYATRAYELRDRLTDRERLLVEATYHWYVEGDAREAADTYERLLAQYPDDYTAVHNLAVEAGSWLGEPHRAYPAALKAVELNPYSVLGIGNAISYARDVDRWDVADSLIGLAVERGFEDDAVRWSRSQALGRGDWERAEALCDSLLAEPSSPVRLESEQRICGSIDLARGRFRRGIELLSASAAHAIPSGSRNRVVGSQYALALAEAMRGRPEAGGDHVAAILDYFPAGSLGDIDRHISRTSMRSLAAFLGQVEVAARVAATYPPYPDPDHQLTRYGEALAGGVEALARGDPEEALRTFEELRVIDFRPRPWRPFQKLAFGLTFAELGQVDSAVAYLEALIAPAEIAGRQFARIQLPAIERRLAELEESRGNIDAAIRHYQRFLELWADADPELQYQVDDARRALARLSAMEND